MAGRRKQSLRVLVLAIDGVLIAAAMAITVEVHALLRAHLDLIKHPPNFAEYAPLVVSSLPLLLILIAALGVDRLFERAWSPGQLGLRLLAVHALAGLGLAVLSFVLAATINRSLVAVFLAVTWILLLCERLLLTRWRRFQHDSGQGQTRILLVGEDDDGDLGRFARARGGEGLPPHLVGRLSSTGGDAALDAVALRLGGIDDIERVLHDNAVDLVLFFPPWNHPRDAAAALSACETVGIPAGFAIELVQRASAPPRVVDLYDRPFVTFEVAPKSAAALALKHAFDVLAAGLGLLLIAPVLALIALAILVTMGRPILFGQERAGLNGRRFRMLKFRTMVPGAERMQEALQAQNEMSGPVFKVKADPRITPLGRVLRRTSLDELPQLFNVLSGRMSLIGPRPLPIHEQAKIRGWHRRRLSMKPGITGMWQVSGRSGIDFDDWMKLDLRYIDEWSLALDLIILARTFPAVVSSRGAH
jgi:exopolysaccharide biosynthesis polyprenyl glycosylphosphotransferase